MLIKLILATIVLTQLVDITNGSLWDNAIHSLVERSQTVDVKTSTQTAVDYSTSPTSLPSTTSDTNQSPPTVLPRRPPTVVTRVKIRPSSIYDRWENRDDTAELICIGVVIPLIVICALLSARSTYNRRRRAALREQMECSVRPSNPNYPNSSVTPATSSGSSSLPTTLERHDKPPSYDEVVQGATSNEISLTMTNPSSCESDQPPMTSLELPSTLPPSGCVMSEPTTPIPRPPSYTQIFKQPMPSTSSTSVHTNAYNTF